MLLYLAHCSSLHEMADCSQAWRPHALQAVALPSQPSGDRQTLRLVCRPSSQDLEHFDHGDHGPHVVSGRITFDIAET